MFLLCGGGRKKRDETGSEGINQSWCVSADAQEMKSFLSQFRGREAQNYSSTLRRDVVTQTLQDSLHVGPSFIHRR